MLKQDLLLMDSSPDSLLKQFNQGVVSLKSLCLVMLLSELNQLDLCRTDIGNAYLEVCTKEKLFIVAGPEFGKLKEHFLGFVQGTVWYKNCWCLLA